MTQSTASVTVEITGGPSIIVPWANAMSAQAALELAWNKIYSTKKFTYGLQYYGTSLGYMVFMVNETFDSFLFEAEPYFYWEFFVDNAPQSQGIDSVILAAGAKVTFAFTQYVATQHVGTTLESKHLFQKSQLAK